MAPVYDQYGCCEVYLIAAQCAEKKHLHWSHDIRHVEFVDEEGGPVDAEVTGRILVTDLEDYLFPLIRYEIGDRGKWIAESCGCGVNLPLMGKVIGRTTDMFTMPDGTKIAGDYLTTVFDDDPDIVSAFQFRQQENYEIKLLLVPNRLQDSIDSPLKKIKAELEKRLKGRVPITFEKVDTIPHDRGKLQYIISEVED